MKTGRLVSSWPLLFPDRLADSIRDSTGHFCLDEWMDGAVGPTAAATLHRPVVRSAALNASTLGENGGLDWWATIRRVEQDQVKGGDGLCDRAG